MTLNTPSLPAHRPAESLQAFLNTPLQPSTSKAALRLAYVMIKMSAKSLTQSHIDNLTLISKQSIKYRKQQNGAQSFFTEELQLIINTSCRQILETFFRKWFVFGVDAAGKRARKEAAAKAMARVVEAKAKALEAEALVKLGCYRQMVDRNSGQVEQRALLAFKLSQMKVGVTVSPFSYETS